MAPGDQVVCWATARSPTWLNFVAPAGTRRSSHRIVIITDDVLTESMAGPAIRAWEIAGALSDRHEVILATTSTVCARRSHRFLTESADPDRFAELEAWCDMVLVQGYVLERAPAFKQSDKTMVVDLYDPIFFEDLEWKRLLPAEERDFQLANVVRVFEDQIRRGDFFICASEKQRDLWMGFLAACGRINMANYERDPSLRALVDVVAFGLPTTPARHSGVPAIKGAFDGIGPQDEVVLWGGGVYDWLDPVTAIRAIELLRSVRPNIRLFFMGVKHPSPFAEESRTLSLARQVAADLGLVGSHVFFNETWVPYETRADYLMEADIAISLHSDHVESAYSFRTRILDCIWAGIPTVATCGDTFAELIEQEGLGVTVAPGDADEVANAIETLLNDPGRRERCRKHASEIASGYSWDAVLRPLLLFCEYPQRAADSPRPIIERVLLPEAEEEVIPRPLLHRVVAAYRRGGPREVARATLNSMVRRL